MSGNPSEPTPPRGAVRRSIKSARVSVAPERVSSSPDAPHAFEVKDKFDLHGLLGEGGMGSVFIAQDRRLGRVVALKVLRKEYDRDADLLRRFALEAQVGAQLEHPNIVPLYSLERADNGGPAFAMQLVEGTTMAQYMADAAGAPREARAPNGEYALKKRLTKLLGACDAMQFAHERGVIHRDLKPENIMLGAHHEVYVMDWGLARVTVAPREATDAANDGKRPAPSTFDLAPTVAPLPSNGSASTFERSPTLVHSATAAAPADTASKLVAGMLHDHEAAPSAGQRATQHGMVFGTYQYMPPEQAMGLIDEVGPAVDQYALGLILLELGTLRSARNPSSAMDAQREAILNQYSAGDDVDGKPLDPALLAIVERATQAEVYLRYPSVEALAEDVRRFIRDEPVSVYREGRAKRGLRLAARHPIGVFSALAAVLILGAAAVIASLAQSAATARRAADDLQGLKRLLVAVHSRAHEVDVRLSDYALSLERVGAVANEILTHEKTRADPTALKAIAEAPMPALKWNDRSQAQLSFHAGLITWAGRAQGAAAPASLPAVKRILAWQREALVAALPPDVAPTEAAQADALEAGKSPFLRIFLGLADGAYAQFPARELPDSYDARKRQWYRMALAARTLGWHPPIAGPAAKTLRLPALLPIRRGEEVLGAVGLDVLVDELAETLLLPDMPGFVDAYLVSQQGKVLVRRGLSREVLKPGVDVDADVALPALADAALAARIATGEKGGYLAAGSRLLLFVKMVSPAWYYVAEFERAPYLSHKLPPGSNANATPSG